MNVCMCVCIYIYGCMYFCLYVSRATEHTNIQTKAVEKTYFVIRYLNKNSCESKTLTLGVERYISPK